MIEIIIKREDLANAAAETDNFSRMKSNEEAYIDGLVEGSLMMLVSQICEKLEKKKTPTVIAYELEEDLDLIRRICGIAMDYAPDYVERADEIMCDFLENDFLESGLEDEDD